MDVITPFLCTSWPDATAPGLPPYHAVIIGAGSFGAYCAAKAARAGRRVLLLDAGPVILPEHVQNVGDIGLRVPRDGTPDPAGVWRRPWRSNVESPGQAFCVGGRSLYSGGWLTRLTDGDLLDWPKETALAIQEGYAFTERETGVEPAWDFVSGGMHALLLPLLRDAAARVAALGAVTDAPLAVQAAPPESGLFSFDKFSSVPVLVDAVRADRERAARRLHVVPAATVTRLRHGGGRVTAIEVVRPARREVLRIPPSCAVVLALGAVESTRLALHSFPTPLMGRNLMVPLRSDLEVRIHRSALPDAPTHGIATVLVRGVTGFHLQITAFAGATEKERLFRMVPDLDELDRLRAETDPEWVSAWVRVVGETRGDRDTRAGTPGGSWITLDHDSADGEPRAYVSLHAGPAETAAWRAMDAAAVALLRALVPDPEKIRYRYDGRWHRTPFPVHRPGIAEWRNGLGVSHRESGTLWMGDDPATSVTNPDGRFHHLTNAYACDTSIFPAIGSAGPMLTGLTLARRLAGRL
ncbi:choline dehydrogenase-like flavoprotein [Catenuloplanes nepalensis]|uniref:Choline dehydrogenase-like flavoprotein n=1 Tax=Catenuloplanes nepalensis TaxID=587533 RepID=A0ABT9MTF3_9ACTN|nr:GMC oxidoreductase [Catenuloplanes nepalensis]MDP9794301.1 choline dehydrogenase-like flavoprotein [Catenuloplanes nepalensis]